MVSTWNRHASIPDMSARTIGAIVTAALLAGVAYLQLSTPRGPVAPSIPAVSSCKDLKPGMKRIGGRFYFKNNLPIFRFDVPTTGVNISDEGWVVGDVGGEMPLYAFMLTRGSSRSYLHILWGDEASWGAGGTDRRDYPIPSALLPAPGHSESHKIFDDTRNQIGEDSWGYRQNGEYWRRVHLVGFLNARYGSKNDKDIPSYGSVQEQDAAVFDQIIDSVCRLASLAE
jgi:hypothetical protein